MTDTVTAETHDPGELEAQARRQEEAQAGRWLKRIKSAIKHDRDARKQWQKWRSYARGGCKDAEGAEYAVDAPVLKSVLETQLSQLYAKNPEVAVDPSESVGDARDETVRDFARTSEIVLTRWFRDSKIKNAIRRAIRAAQVVPCGVLKLSLQVDKQRDPVIERRMNDLQDNLTRLRALQEQAGEPDGDQDATIADIEQQYRALQQQADANVRKGFVLDPYQLEDWLVDPGCAEVVDHLNADWQAFRTWMTPEKCMATFGLTVEEVDEFTRYTERKSDADTEEGTRERTTDSTDPAPGWIAVWEVWSLVDSTVYTVAEGGKGYLRAPYTPDYLPSQFYPTHLLGFSWIDGERWPQSTVEACHKLQDEYSTARSRLRVHRQRAIPKTGFNAALLPAPEARKLENADLQEMVPLKLTDPNITNMAQVLAPIAYAQVDMGLYDVSPIMRDIEQMVGLQDAARTTMVKAKTATEAQIMEQGASSRSDSARENVETLVNDVARCMLEMGLQAYTADEIRRIAGERAIWPDFTKDQVYDVVEIAMRAGSSGRPDTAAEREAWAALLPLLQALIGQIAQAQASGMHGVAVAYEELLRESFRRVDERIDVAKFLPSAQPIDPMTGLPAVPQLPGELPVPSPEPEADPRSVTA